MNQDRKGFNKSLKVKFEKISTPKKKVESHICYGDGLGIKKKLCEIGDGPFFREKKDRPQFNRR